MCNYNSESKRVSEFDFLRINFIIIRQLIYKKSHHKSVSLGLIFSLFVGCFYHKGLALNKDIGIVGIR